MLLDDLNMIFIWITVVLTVEFSQLSLFGMLLRRFFRRPCRLNGWYLLLLLVYLCGALRHSVCFLYLSATFALAFGCLYNALLHKSASNGLVQYYVVLFV